MYSHSEVVSQQKHYLQAAQGFLKAEVYVQFERGQRFVFKDYSRFRFHPLAAPVALYLVKREARRLAKLADWAYSPKVYPSASPWVLKQECIQGQVLSATTKLSADQVRQIQQMVTELHQLGFSHNDIRASNIMLSRGQPRLIDFTSAMRFRFYRSPWFALARRLDNRHVVKLKQAYGFELSAAEQRLLKQAWPLRLIKNTWKKGLLPIFKAL